MQYRQQCGGWFKTGVGRPVLGPLPFSRAGRGNRVQTKIQDFTRSVDTHARFSSKRFLWISLQKGPFELGRHKGRIVQEELITVKKIFLTGGFECKFMLGMPPMLVMSGTYFTSIVFLFWRHL